MDVMDEITLTGLRAFARHGVFEHERAEGQLFVIDLTLYLPLGDAAAGDDLTKTVHYGELAEAVVAAVESDPVDLIETVAERIATLVLGRDIVNAVRVTVHKPEAPITVPFADVSVTVMRVRPAVPELSRRVVVALGANLGDREATLRSALEELAGWEQIRIERVSAFHETIALTPHGADETAPAYLNGAAILTTTLEPLDLLDVLAGIEARHGRVRAERWGDRTLDLDIVDVGGAEAETERLTLPHPRAHEREFVLAPWLEIDPDAMLPGHGRVADLLERLRRDGGDA